MDAQGNYRFDADGNPNPAFDPAGDNYPAVTAGGVTVPPSSPKANPTLVDLGGSPYEGTQRPSCDTKLVPLANGRSIGPDCSTCSPTFPSRAALLGSHRGRPELLDRSEADQLRREGRRAVRSRRHLRPRQPARLHDRVRLQRLVRHAPAVDEPHQLPDAVRACAPTSTASSATTPAYPDVSTPTTSPTTARSRPSSRRCRATPSRPTSPRPRSACRCSCPAAKPSPCSALRLLRFRSSSRSSKPYVLGHRFVHHQGHRLRAVARGTVTLDATPITVTSWSDSTIQATVPAGTPVGPHQLRITTSTGLTTVNGADLPRTRLGCSAVPQHAGARPTSTAPTRTVSARTGVPTRRCGSSISSSASPAPRSSAHRCQRTHCGVRSSTPSGPIRRRTRPSRNSVPHPPSSGSCSSRGSVRSVSVRTNTNVQVRTTANFGLTWQTQATFPAAVPVGSVLGAAARAGGTVAVYVNGSSDRVGERHHDRDPVAGGARQQRRTDRCLRIGVSDDHDQRRTTRQLRWRQLRGRGAAGTRRTCTRSVPPALRPTPAT